MYAHKESLPVPKEHGREKLQNDKLSGSNTERYGVGGQRERQRDKESETQSEMEGDRERKIKKINRRVFFGSDL